MVIITSMYQYKPVDDLVMTGSNSDCHCRLLKECNVLISKAFRGQLVISEFAEFSVDVKEIYDKCAPNMRGIPAQYIPQLARQCSPLSLVQLHRGSTLIGRELQSVAKPAISCHKEPAWVSKASY